MPNNLEEHAFKGLESLLYQLKGKEINQNQQNAAAILSENGLPTRRAEMWKYTDLRWINQHVFSRADHVDHEQVQNWLDENIFNSIELSDLPRLVIVNGQVVKEFSNLLGTPSYNVELNGSNCEDLSQPHRDFMTALNCALSQKSIQLTIPKKQKVGTILLVHLGYGNDGSLVSSHPRIDIKLQEQSQLSVIELNAGYGKYFANPVSQVILGSGADLQYNKLINSSLESYLCSNLYVSLSDHAKYQQFIITKGAKFSRQEIYIDLHGEWSNASFQAVQKLNSKQHADVTTVFSHLVPHCDSYQNIKNILSDQSHGVFQGKVFVHQKAQKTNAQQQNQALLLSEQAEINTKPELEIYADDVKCSHGATVGALDEDQIFFLMARGIPFEKAKEILINAFIVQAVEEIYDPIAKNIFKKQLGVEIVEDIT